MPEPILSADTPGRRLWRPGEDVCVSGWVRDGLGCYYSISQSVSAGVGIYSFKTNKSKNPT